MHTAWRRFDSARDGGRSAFNAHMRALEVSASELNLAPESVHLAAELAALEPALKDDDRIALIVLILVSLVALQDGSTRFPVVGPLSRAPMRSVLGSLCAKGFGDEAVATIAASIEGLVQSDRASAVVGRREDEYKPLLYFAPYIVHHRIYHYECELAIRLAALLTTGTQEQADPENLSRALRDVIARPVIVQGKQIVMSDEQCNVVAASARTGLTVVSGGPGTGKTSIIVAIMRLMVRLGVDPSQIALAAPTGKAAYRMRECIGESLTRIERLDSVDQALVDAHLEPATIHRMLGYSPESGRFRHHRNNPLSAKVLIVDEGSMLDVTLMERLTNAIQPGARLIVLGDADQLPSVAAGSVFRDLVPSAGDDAGPLTTASIRLEVNHRMQSERSAGRSILLAARSINDGDAKLLNSIDESNTAIVARRSSPDELTFAGVEFITAASRELGSFLDRWYADRVRGGPEIAELVAHEYVERDGRFDDADCERLRHLFTHAGKSRILCVTRVFETGAERINARLHSRAAESAGVAAERAPFVVGEPLIVLRNDYERGLFNGDNGIRLWVRRRDGSQVPTAIFPRGDNFVAFRFEALREFVELGYAMTVHKAQGSEFDSIAIVLPEKPVAVLTRELIYTAVSRSRTSVVIVGDESTLNHAIASRVERFSGLADRIKLALAG
ncbi:exodeoxyribonuclease V subunit alpha [Candidatus Binatus sp.]|jgi:exodeoxyribonuclease V alpha subunit|uniref:exodeoxyribonuclease V subunit alpha n=2 Tax=Candidatus Binatus sp. TaxID=2811406 RepID=UPI003C56FB3D